MQITIETLSRQEAEAVASELPGAPKATAVRGYGLIRYRCRSNAEVDDLLSVVNDAVRRHRLPWVRVRRGDDEHVFRGADRG